MKDYKLVFEVVVEANNEQEAKEKVSEWDLSDYLRDAEVYEWVQEDYNKREQEFHKKIRGEENV